MEYEEIQKRKEVHHSREDAQEGNDVTTGSGAIA
jgi:hypothetical protein